MPYPSLDEERSLAWLKMKVAVRDYAHNPSRGNAQKVEIACNRLRCLDRSMPLMRASMTPVRRRPSGSGTTGNKS